jgi:hypothetical protein
LLSGNRGPTKGGKRMTKRDVLMMLFGAILGVSMLYVAAWVVEAMEPPDSPYPFNQSEVI